MQEDRPRPRAPSRRGGLASSLAVAGVLLAALVLVPFVSDRVEPSGPAPPPRFTFALEEALAPGTELHLVRVRVGGVPLRRAPYVQGPADVRVELKYRVDKDRGGPIIEVDRQFRIEVPPGPHGTILKGSVKENPAAAGEVERFAVALTPAPRAQPPAPPRLVSPGEAESRVRVRPEVRLPEGAAAPGKSLYVVAKVCVEDTGEVREVTLTKGEGPAVDGAVVEALEHRLYRPFMSGARAVPFCHPLRLGLRVAWR
jgi:hypothetical protein